MGYYRQTVDPLVAVIVGILLLTTVLLVGVPLAEGDNSAVQIAKIHACQTLPVAQRASCLNQPASPVETREQAAQVCTHLIDQAAAADAQSSFWAACMSDLIDKP